MKTKSFGIDIIFPWEVGLALVIIGVLIAIIGVRQSKKEIDHFDNFPLSKPATKLLFGCVLIIFGLIQLLQLLN